MGRPKPLRSVQRQFWRLVAQCVTTAAACEALDVLERAGDHGGGPRNHGKSTRAFGRTFQELAGREPAHDALMGI